MSIENEDDLIGLRRAGRAAADARDAMAAKYPHGGGKLTIQTRSASIAEIRRRGTDVILYINEENKEFWTFMRKIKR